MPARRPGLLTIAGSDSGGGAGIQADLKTFAAFGGYGMSVLTAVTAQNTRRVTAIHPVPPDIVAAQIDAVFDDIEVDAVKIGMLGNAKTVSTVADRLRAYRPRYIVLDPVMVAKSGDTLLVDEAVAALRDQLLPLATLLTPNLPEATRLTGIDLDGAFELDRSLAAAHKLRALMSRDDQPRSRGVLLKGGHGDGDTLTDLWLDDSRHRLFEQPRIATRSTHGTGCTLSSAIAAGLGAGVPADLAVADAIDYLHGAIEAARPIGRDPDAGHGPVDHLYRLASKSSAIGS